MKVMKPWGVIAALTIAATTLAGCTNASEQGSSENPTPGSSAAASFDPSTVTADSALADKVPAAIKDRGTLIIGTDVTYEPAEFLDENQKPAGYDLDMARSIAMKLGLKPDVQAADFTGILPALGAKYDIGISSFTITPERLDSVNMVGFFMAGTSWATQSGNPKNFDPKDPCGKSVGVQTGTTQEDELEATSKTCTSEGKGPIDIVTLSKQTDVTTRLANGQLDAMIGDSPLIANAITKTNGALEQVGDVTGEAVQGIATAKSDTALADLVQQALQSLKEDGSYAKVLETWGVSDSAVDTFEVNPKVS